MSYGDGSRSEVSEVWCSTEELLVLAPVGTQPRQDQHPPGVPAAASRAMNLRSSISITKYTLCAIWPSYRYVFRHSVAAILSKTPTKVNKASLRNGAAHPSAFRPNCIEGRGSFSLFSSSRPLCRYTMTSNRDDNLCVKSQHV
jgi:hypothetical protein